MYRLALVARFFKEVLSREEAARDFILHYLPSGIVALLDIDSLETRKDSFVDKDLKGEGSA